MPEPRLIGLLSFYDEPPQDLVACIKGLHDAGVDELVAVDGAYALYPGGTACSHPNQHAAIHLACRELGMGCHLHVPRTVWEGNEVEKRTFLFAAGLLVAEPGDWYWPQDADMVPTVVPADLKERLAATEHDAADVQILDVVALEAKQKDWPPRFDLRGLFRAQPLTVKTNHITYMTDDGRMLRGWDGDDVPLEPALDLTDLVVEHRPHTRPRERQLAKLQYYATRDEAQVERGACSRCGKQATDLVATGWRWTDIGPVADWVEACEACAEVFDSEGRERLRELGIDPDSVQVENRNGNAPQAQPLTVGARR